MRVTLLLILAAGCNTPQYTNGALRCSPTGQCPADFFCAVDEHCWAVGSGPDLSHVADAGPGDLSVNHAPPGPADLSASLPIDLALPDDLMRPDDATTTPFVQLGHVTTGNATLTAPLPSPSHVGTLLILTAVFDGNGNSGGPGAGWNRESGWSMGADAEIWYLANNPGGITSVSTTFTGTTTSVGQMSEWSVSTVDQLGWCFSGSTATVMQSCPTMTSTSPPTVHGNELGIAVFALALSSAAPVTLSHSGGWITLGNNQGTSTKLHYAFDYALDIGAGTTIGSVATSSVTGYWGGATASFY